MSAVPLETASLTSKSYSERKIRSSLKLAQWRKGLTCLRRLSGFPHDRAHSTGSEVLSFARSGSLRDSQSRLRTKKIATRKSPSPM